MRAKDVLLDALMRYDGTVVFVSHDRYFIDKLAARVFEVGNGGVEIYHGNYEDYLWRKQGGGVSQAAIPELPAQPTIQPSNGDGTNLVPEAKSKRLNPIKRKQMEDRFHEIEEEITRVEAAIAECEAGLQNFVSPEETQRLTHNLSKNRTDLQNLLAEWEQLGQALEA
jgi:ATP-binding cassette subfamily F protein 3